VWRRCCAASVVAAALIAAPAEAFDVLVFTKTESYRHESIPDGVAAIRELGAANGFTVVESVDGGVMSDEGLAPYELVLFLSTNREILDDAQQAALERYVRGGGGWMGVHGAADTEYAWPFYGELLAGGWFKAHPPIQPATVVVEDHSHPSTRDIPAGWRRSDEWYAFHASPRGRARVLLRVEESSYQPGDTAMGFDHPIAWCHDIGLGRSWFTAMGHTPESYAEPEFRRLLLGGILTASGQVPADCTPRPRDAPELDVPAEIRLAALRHRGVPVALRCPRGCTARLKLAAGGRGPTDGRRVSRLRTVRVRPGAVVRVRLRVRRGARLRAPVRVVAAVKRDGLEETLVRTLTVL
jgi:type 1 glutamine amidotransferase